MKVLEFDGEFDEEDEISNTNPIQNSNIQITEIISSENSQLQSKIKAIKFSFALT